MYLANVRRRGAGPPYDAAPAETPVDKHGRDPRLSPNVTLAADEDDVRELGRMF